ncbi:MAG: TolC family protein [Bacillota bacterium]
MYRKKIIICILLLLVILITPTRAEDEKLTLEDLFTSTLENNNDLQNSRQELKQSEALLKQARSGRDWRSDLMLDYSEQKTPSSVESLYDMTEEEVDDTISTHSESIAFSRIAIDSLRNNADKKQAEKALQEKRFSLQQKKLEIVEDLVENFYDLITAYRGVELAEKVVAQRENSLEREEKKLEEEESVPKDVLEAESDLAEAESTLQAARESLELAEDNLAQYTGREEITADNIVIPDFKVDNLPDEANPWPWDLTKMQQIALEENPDVQRASIAKDVTKIDLKEARIDKLPDISLTGSYTSAEDQARLGLELTDDYRFIGSITHLDTNLPEIDEEDIELDEVDSDQFEDTPYEDVTISDEQLADVLSSITSGTGTGSEDQWQVSINIEYNIFDSGVTKSKIKEKEESTKQAESQKNDAEDKIKLAVHKNYNKLQDSYRQIKTAETNYRQARQQYKDVKKMKENEMATQEEVELAELNMLRSKNDLEETFYDYEKAKTKIATILGLEIDWFIDSLSLK